jgi:hypothetical protein
MLKTKKSTGNLCPYELYIIAAGHEGVKNISFEYLF